MNYSWLVFILHVRACSLLKTRLTTHVRAVWAAEGDEAGH